MKNTSIQDLLVSYDTRQLLIHYESLIREWNSKFNLVAESTLKDIENRHFLDSAQLFPLIPLSVLSIADMGAGAGFPGLVLAILAQTQDKNWQFVEVESIAKKADFLQTVVDALKLTNVQVRRDRIEIIKDLKPDLIVARALKPLLDLFKYAHYLKRDDTVCLFLKGKTVEDELTQARKYWTFNCTKYPSQSSADGTVLAIDGLRYKSRR